ncbi:MAG: sensor histidine kinase [Chromatiales bacterium]|nr:sensor histidine kinase [Chromatiales bacterium]
MCHTPAGAAPPAVTLSATPEGATLTVRDHGTGIAPEHLPHLTEPFYRADPARRRETGGYGLGLYLCRVIAEAHGGMLAIESTPGRGTTVRVMLPRHDSAHG